jgi:hypothetical protein
MAVRAREDWLRTRDDDGTTAAAGAAVSDGADAEEVR